MVLKHPFFVIERECDRRPTCLFCEALVGNTGHETGFLWCPEQVELYGLFDKLHDKPTFYVPTSRRSVSLRYRHRKGTCMTEVAME